MQRFNTTLLIIITLCLSVFPLRAQQINDCEKPLRALLKERGITISNGNKLHLFFNGHDKFVDLFEQVAQAKDHVHLEYFNFRNDSIASLTFDHLGEVVQRGVEVRAMYDDFGNMSNNQPLKKEHIKDIKSKGIEIVTYDPIRFPWVNHIFSRDHRKIVVIDGRIGYTGGMNIADYYVTGLEGVGPWHDIHMRIEGPAVSKLQDIFMQAWNQESKEHVNGFKYHPITVIPEAEADSAATLPLEERIELIGKRTHSNVSMAIVDRATGHTSDAIRKTYAAAIDGAKEHIQIVNPYFAPTHRVRKALKKALKRGVRVEIMLPAKSDIKFTPEAGEYIAHKLMKRGAEVYLFNGGFHHSKIMMVDSTFCTVGTSNLNSRSLRYDNETNAFIFDEGTTDELSTMFERDKQSCTVMTPAYWKERSRWKKFMGWVGNLLTPFL